MATEGGSVLSRLFPRQSSNDYRGARSALALYVLFLLLKLAMSVNSLVFTRTVVTQADGIPIDSYGAGGAQAVLSLFALLSWGQLMLAIVAIVVLIRYRTLVPLMFLILLIEHIGRCVLLMLFPIDRPDGTPVGFYINIGIAVVLLLGLLLSLTVRKARAAA